MSWWTAIVLWLQRAYEILFSFENWYHGFFDVLEIVFDFAFSPAEMALDSFGGVDFSPVNHFVDFAEIFIPVGDSFGSLVLFFELLLVIFVIKTTIKLIPTIG